MAYIVGDLGPKLDFAKLASLSRAFERSIPQRAGYLLDFAGLKDKTEVLRNSLDNGPGPPWIELEPSLMVKADLAPAVVERNVRWRVIVRRTPQPDD